MQHSMVREMRSLAQLLLLLLLGGVAPLLAQASQSHLIWRVRDVIANQATTELSLYKSAWPEPVDPDHVQVGAGDSAGSGLLFRARVQSIFHWDPYSVLVSDTVIFVMGGSAHEQYLRPAALLRLGATDTTLFGLAQTLVLASETRFGAVIIVPSGTETPASDSEALARWHDARPPEWPESGSTQWCGGKTLIRVTALRPRVDAVPFRFTPVAYAFMFDANGVLLAAAVREGRQF